MILFEKRLSSWSFLVGLAISVILGTTATNYAQKVVAPSGAFVHSPPEIVGKPRVVTTDLVLYRGEKKTVNIPVTVKLVDPQDLESGLKGEGLIKFLAKELENSLKVPGLEVEAGEV